MVHRQARQLLSSGHEVRVFAGDHTAPVPRHQSWEDIHERVAVTRVRITSQDTEHRFANFLNRPVAEILNALIGRWKPDVVHFHNTTGLSLIPYYHSRKLGIPVLVTLHDHWGFCMRNTLINSQHKTCRDFAACANCQTFLQDEWDRQIPISCRKDYFRRRLSVVRCFITPSAYLANQYVRAGFDAQRFAVISNGIDPVLPAAPRITGQPCRFTTICHLGQHKGVHIIFEALRRMPKTLDWRFNLVGVGPLEPDLRRMATNEGFAHRIRFWGQLPNEQIPSVLAETDVYVLASIWAENEPVSILESLARGIPVVASAAGGTPELVQARVNGWLVPVADVTALQRVFTEAISNPPLVRQLAEGALRVGTRWPESRQVARLVIAYEQALRGGLETPLSCPLVAITGHQISETAAAAIALIKQARPEIDVIPLGWLEPEELDLISAVLEITPGDGAAIPARAIRLPAKPSDVCAWLASIAPSIPALAPTISPLAKSVFIKN